MAERHKWELHNEGKLTANLENETKELPTGTLGSLHIILILRKQDFADFEGRGSAGHRFVSMFVKETSLQNKLCQH